MKVSVARPAGEAVKKNEWEEFDEFDDLESPTTNGKTKLKTEQTKEKWDVRNAEAVTRNR